MVLKLNRKDRFLDKGFTITEIILLLAIVGILISGILPVFLNIITTNKSVQYQSAAYKIADSKLESLRAGNFSEIPDNQTIQNPHASLAQLPANASLSVTSTKQVDGSEQTNIRRVEVTVNWYFKRNENIRLVSYIAANGIKK